MIIAIVCDFKSGTSAGYDGIDINVVKRIIHLIASPLSSIFNAWVSKKIVFPDRLKLAKVVPVHKGGKVDDVTNYRPISVLSLFSKIFEKCLYNKLYDFLSSCNIVRYYTVSGRGTPHQWPFLISFIKLL